jgi:hypothetical protein
MWRYVCGGVPTQQSTRLAGGGWGARSTMGLLGREGNDWMTRQESDETQSKVAATLLALTSHGTMAVSERERETLGERSLASLTPALPALSLDATRKLQGIE